MIRAPNTAYIYVIAPGHFGQVEARARFPSRDFAGVEEDGSESKVVIR